MKARMAEMWNRLKELKANSTRTDAEERELKELSLKVRVQHALRHVRIAHEAKREGRLDEFLRRHREALGLSGSFEGELDHALALLAGHGAKEGDISRAVKPTEEDLRQRIGGKGTGAEKRLESLLQSIRIMAIQIREVRETFGRRVGDRFERYRHRRDSNK